MTMKLDFASFQALKNYSRKKAKSTNEPLLETMNDVARQAGFRDLTDAKRHLSKRDPAKDSTETVVGQARKTFQTFEEAWEYLQTFRPSESEIKTWMEGTEIKRFEYGAKSHYYWIKGGINNQQRVISRSDLMPSSIEYQNGKPRSFAWHKNGESFGFGRDSGPAYVQLNEHGDVVWVEFWAGEKMHNSNGPAQIRILTRDVDKRRFANFSYVTNGQWEKPWYDVYEDKIHCETNRKPQRPNSVKVVDVRVVITTVNGADSIHFLRSKIRFDDILREVRKIYSPEPYTMARVESIQPFTHQWEYRMTLYPDYSWRDTREGKKMVIKKRAKYVVNPDYDCWESLVPNWSGNKIAKD